jgi:hypothetical protein
MIRSFNRRQRFKAVGSLVSGFLAYLIAWAFFYFVAGQAFRMSGTNPAPWWVPAITAAVLLLITFSGWRKHRSGQESNFGDAVWWQGEVETLGAAVTQYRVNRMSSSAWFLSVLFTAGPVGFLRAIDLWRSCLPVDHELEQRMTLLLRELRSRNQWVAADSFRDYWEPMSALIRTGHVEFSSIKGRVRASS